MSIRIQNPPSCLSPLQQRKGTICLKLTMVLFFQSSHQLRKLSINHAVSMLSFREPTGPYILRIGSQGFQRFFSQIRIFFDKFCSEGLKNTEDIADNHQLPISIDPGPDTVNRNRQFIPYDSTNLWRDSFHKKRKSPCLLDCLRIL